MLQIIGRIRFDGPMTVAQYMQEILTHPRQGYYMNKWVKLTKWPNFYFTFWLIF